MYEKLNDIEKRYEELQRKIKVVRRDRPNIAAECQRVTFCRGERKWERRCQYVSGLVLGVMTGVVPSPVSTHCTVQEPERR